MTLTTSPKQKIGNINPMSNYNLRCINCGRDDRINLIAYRNEDKYITGFLVVCERCAVLLDKSKRDVKMVIE